MSKARTSLREWRILSEHFEQLTKLDAKDRLLALENLDLEPHLLTKLSLMLESLDHTVSILDEALVDKVEFKEQDFAKKLLGQNFDGYLLDELLHEGQMSAVFLATQREPVDRQVVIKLVRSEAPEEYHDFFRYEQLALTKQTHPNIATIHTVGKTADGIAYIVMEFIDGSPLVDFCDREKLSIRERLRIFLKICDAISYSHRRGILHRDIKSSNILVRNFDDGPIPTIIDFGISSGLNEGIDSNNQFLMGTPGFMSPEHVLNQQDMDARADVYSLGMVLFSLLVGRVPFDRVGLKKADRAKRLSIIAEFELPAPNDYFSDLSDNEKQSLAEQRNTSTALMDRELEEGLDAVYLKATHKNRDERYDSTKEFASDIQRFLDGHVVSPALSNKAYRIKKFIARNKIAVASSLLLAVSGFFASGLIFKQSQTIATEASKAESEKKNADAVANVLLESINLSVPESTIRNSEDSSTELLEHHLSTLQEKEALSDELRLEVSLSLVEAFRRNSQSSRAEELMISILEGFSSSDPELQCRVHSRATTVFGQSANYELHWRHGDITGAVCNSDVKDIDLRMYGQQRYATSEVTKGNLASALAALDGVLELYNDNYSGDSVQLADIHYNFGNIYSFQEDYKASINSFKKTQQILRQFFNEKHARNATIDMVLLSVFCDAGDPRCTEVSGFDVLSRLREAYGNDSHHEHFALVRLGKLYNMSAEYGKAIEVLQSGIDSIESTGDINSSHYTDLLFHMAEALMGSGDFVEAFAIADRAKRKIEQDRNLKRGALDESIVMHKLNYADTLFLNDQIDDAREILDEALELNRTLTKSFDTNFQKAYALKVLIEVQEQKFEAAKNTADTFLTYSKSISNKNYWNTLLEESLYLYATLSSEWDIDTFGLLVETWEKMKEKPNPFYLRGKFLDVDRYIDKNKSRLELGH